MHIRDAHVVNLCQKVPNVFVRGYSVVVVKPQEVENLETPRIQYGVEILWVRLLIRPSMPLRGEPKLPQSPGDLFPDSISHRPIIYLRRKGLPRMQL
jgi:hypothetical protein